MRILQLQLQLKLRLWLRLQSWSQLRPRPLATRCRPFWQSLTRTPARGVGARSEGHKGCEGQERFLGRHVWRRHLNVLCIFSNTALSCFVDMARQHSRRLHSTLSLVQYTWRPAPSGRRSTRSGHSIRLTHVSQVVLVLAWVLAHVRACSGTPEGGSPSP